MNTIEEQQQILDRLCALIQASAPVGFSEAACRFEFHQADDGSRSVDTKFWYVENGIKHSDFLTDDREIRPIRLVPEFHNLMHEHTGGEWSAFTIGLKDTGEARTNFEYPA